MFELDKNTGKWVNQKDTLSKDNYNDLKQDLEKVRLYSKCLSGASYLPINGLDNIYDILENKVNDTWYISTDSTPYLSNPIIPQTDRKAINNDSKNEYYNKFTHEYGLTLKNLFTPDKLVKNSIDNYVYVDVATTTELSGIGDIMINLTIDGIVLKEGHRLLIKDQITTVDLDISVDPNLFFTSNFYEIENNITSKKYYYYNELNGIYIYKNNILIREDDLDTYDSSYRHSVVAKLGSNKDKQFHVSRLLSKYYPVITENQPIEFLEKHNWVLRNRLDYNNIFDINYYDILKHGTQSYVSDGVTYSIPQRVISVGEFGVILNNQIFQSTTLSKIINNKSKINLRSISQTSGYYWVVGDEGTILRISKIDFEIVRIELNEFNDLRSISFFNDLRGIAVGRFNTVYVTLDGGFKWDKVTFDVFDSFSYNKVIFYSFNTIYLGGENGVFLELNYVDNNWNAYNRKISKHLNDDDEYILVDDINDMISISFTQSWTGLTYSGVFTTPVINNKDFILISTNNNNLIVYDINNFVVEHDFMYLSYTQSLSDIRTITNISGSASVLIGSDKVYKLNLDNFNDINSSSNVISSSSSITIDIINDIFVNKLFDYNGDELYLCGNNSMLLNNIYGSASFNEIDSSFEDKIKSRMLFLDYDIASKLNFFDDNQIYRLPDPVLFSPSFSSFTISSVDNEYNWLDYYKDSNKTFKYYTSIDSSNEVLFSSTFTKHTSGYSMATFSSSSVKIGYNDIIGLAPSFGITGSSEFISNTPTISYPSPTSSSVFMYKNIIVFKVLSGVSGFNADSGDILNISSNTVNTNLTINRIDDLGVDKYIYCYSGFNNNIINNLKLDTIRVTNLNKFKTISELISRFEDHTISLGYKLELLPDNNVRISTRFNNITAYYNMSSIVSVDSTDYVMSYKDSFLKFGFSPTYNIHDYLSKIDIGFTQSKRFLTMPRYENLPGNNNNSFTSSNIFVDTGTASNKLIFGDDLKFEWETIWVNTFVDVNFNSNSETNPKMLVTKKYFDDDVNGYVVEFHKKMKTPNSVNTIDFLSRDTLGEISSDLQIINNIQRSSTVKNIQNINTFVNLQNEINFKVSTDSYAKILLSDGDIKRELSSLLYIDDNNELSMNVINLDREFDFTVLNLSNDSGKLRITFNKPHNIKVGDSILLNLIGGNPLYIGYHLVESFTINTITVTVSYIDSIFTSGVVTYVQNDPFFNYQPSNIIDIGVDKRVKRSVKINPENFDTIGNKHVLIGLDLTKYTFQLVDGLSFEELSTKFPWVLEAEITDAVIGRDDDGIIWYSGTWECGRWFGGTWISGKWITGDWYKGTWKSLKTKYNGISVEVDISNTDDSLSKWYDGRWFDGTWEGGTWYSGRRYSGDWNTGKWYDGVWNDGHWINGEFLGGVWVNGLWDNGLFNTDNKPSFWIDGKWYGGDFENGTWYNGLFGEKSGNKSRFGTKSSNTRKSIWDGGKWLSGEFHSRLNLDSNGMPIVSDVHKYSIWNTGLWSTGNWYGGISYNIDFRSGIWHGGIMDDIIITGVDTDCNQITLKGIFRFNIGDEIYIIGDVTPSFEDIGSDNNPKKYRILNVFESNGNTVLLLNIESTFVINIFNTDNGLRIVGSISNSTWDSGVWYNGIFTNGQFNSGIWYGGIFNGTWGN